MIHALLILMMGTPAQAFDYSCLIHKVDFVGSREGLQKVSLPLAIMNAVPKVQLVEASGKILEQCSAATVSDSGNLLTSGNCVDDCLKNAGAYQPGEDGVPHIDRAKLADVSCHFKLNDGQVVTGHVLAIGDCRMRESMKANVKCDGADYAIVKIDGRNEAQACFKVSGEPAVAGTKLATVGYPTHTYRFAERQAAEDAPKGFAQEFSAGQALAPKESCNMRVDRDAKEQKFKKDESMDFVMERARNGTFMQTDVDQVDGSGGGPLIDLKSGEVRGIATLTMKTDIFVECQGSSFAVATPAILADLKKNYPAVDSETVFGCRTHAVVSK